MTKGTTIRGLRRRGVRMLLVATTILASATGIALATIPGSNGIINGCYEKRTGILRVIDAGAGKTCMSFETPISWNEGGAKGPTGDKGPLGDKGPTGDKGPAGDKGPQGDQGIAGDKGPAGDQGPQGNPGDKGPVGDKGPQGDPGPSGGAFSSTSVDKPRAPIMERMESLRYIEGFGTLFGACRGEAVEGASASLRWRNDSSGLEYAPGTLLSPGEWTDLSLGGVFDIIRLQGSAFVSIHAVAMGSSTAGNPCRFAYRIEGSA